MKAVFAETYYFVAQLNPGDEAHAKAASFTKSFTGRLWTTDWVLVELGDAFCRGLNRTRFTYFYRQLPGLPDLTIVPADRLLLELGINLYEERPDKDWSLTDCLSFAVMQREGLTDSWLC